MEFLKFYSHEVETVLLLDRLMGKLYTPFGFSTTDNFFLSYLFRRLFLSMRKAAFFPYDKVYEIINFEIIGFFYSWFQKYQLTIASSMAISCIVKW